MLLILSVNPYFELKYSIGVLRLGMDQKKTMGIIVPMKRKHLKLPEFLSCSLAIFDYSFENILGTSP